MINQFDSMKYTSQETPVKKAHRTIEQVFEGRSPRLSRRRGRVNAVECPTFNSTSCEIEIGSQ